jgi:hypothetical protein
MRDLQVITERISHALGESPAPWENLPRHGRISRALGKFPIARETLPRRRTISHAVGKSPARRENLPAHGKIAGAMGKYRRWWENLPDAGGLSEVAGKARAGRYASPPAKQHATLNRVWRWFGTYKSQRHEEMFDIQGPLRDFVASWFSDFVV